jgi:hypothetical protein
MVGGREESGGSSSSDGVYLHGVGISTSISTSAAAAAAAADVKPTICSHYP